MPAAQAGVSMDSAMEAAKSAAESRLCIFFIHVLPFSSGLLAADRYKFT